MMSVALTDLYANYDVLAGIRFYAHVGLTNADADFEGIRVCLQTTTITDQNYGVFKGYASGVGYASFANLASSNVADVRPLVGDTSHDVVMVELPYAGSRLYRIWTGLWSSGWPTLANMRLLTDTIVATAASYTPRMVLPSLVRLAFATTTNNVSGTLETRILHMRVDTL
jgi:hypothetical protein